MAVECASICDCALSGGDVKKLDFRFFAGNKKIGAPFHGLKAFFTTGQLNVMDKVRQLASLVVLLVWVLSCCGLAFWVAPHAPSSACPASVPFSPPFSLCFDHKGLCVQQIVQQATTLAIPLWQRSA